MVEFVLSFKTQSKCHPSKKSSLPSGYKTISPLRHYHFLVYFPLGIMYLKLCIYSVTVCLLGRKSWTLWEQGLVALLPALASVPRKAPGTLEGDVHSLPGWIHEHVLAQFKTPWSNNVTHVFSILSYSKFWILGIFKNGSIREKKDTYDYMISNTQD
jgi:hypothetical protein